MALGKILVDFIEDGDKKQHTVSELQSVYEVIARANNTTSDDVALYDTSSSLSANYLYIDDIETTLVAWDTLTTPYVCSSYSVNAYGGYDVVTDQGTFEFVTPENYNLRNGGNGWAAKLYSVTNMKGWGHDGTNLADVVTKITTYATNASARIEVELDADSVLAAGVAINSDYISLNLCKHSVDCSAVSAAAFTVDSETPSEYNNAIMGLGNGVIFAAKATGQIGVLYNSDTSGASCRSFLKDIVIYNFDVGIQYEDRAYLVKNNNVNIYNCNTCIYTVLGTDSGENISFVDSAMYNSTLICKVREDSTTLTFNNCSWDYSTQVLDMDGGNVRFFGGHIETGSSSTHLIITGGYADLQPCILRFDGTTAMEYYAHVGVGAHLRIRTRINFGNQITPTSGKFYYGSGDVDIENINPGYMPKLLSNNLLDFKFSQPYFNALTNEIMFITGATAWQTSDYASIAVSSNALVVTKTTTGDCTVAIAVPVEKTRQIGCNIGVTSDTTVSYGYDIQYANLDMTGDMPVINKTTSLKTGTTLTGSQTVTGNITPDQAPAWATHWLIEFDVSDLIAAETLTVSNAIIQTIG